MYRGEALKLAVLLLLEKLSPTERAAYVLREAFDYPYDQIASILQMEEANIRQLVSRARKHIADGRRTSVSSHEQRRFLEAFISAAQKGDMIGLEHLFAENVVSYSDRSTIIDICAERESHLEIVGVMTDLTSPRMVGNPDEQLVEAVEELITGVSDDPPLSEDSIQEMLNNSPARGSDLGSMS